MRGQGSDRQMAWVPWPPPVTRTTTGRSQQVPGSLLWKERKMHLGGVDVVPGWRIAVDAAGVRSQDSNLDPESWRR